MILPPSIEPKKPVIKSSVNKFECGELDQNENDAEDEKEEIEEKK